MKKQLINKNAARTGSNGLSSAAVSLERHDMHMHTHTDNRAALLTSYTYSSRYTYTSKYNYPSSCIPCELRYLYHRESVHLHKHSARSKTSSPPFYQHRTFASSAAPSTNASYNSSNTTNNSNNPNMPNKEGDPTKFAITIQNLTKRLGTTISGYGQRTLFHDVSLSFYEGAKLGIVGANGSGKSTFLKILAGVDKDYDGTVEVTKGLRIGYLHQEPLLHDSTTVGECIQQGIAYWSDLLKEYDSICAEFGDENADYESLLEKQSKIQHEIEVHDVWNIQYRVDQAMEALRCPPKDADISTLSGGEKRRVALTRLLLSSPDILLLDEPTNHLDHMSVKWLETYLQQYKGLVLVITHDRYFLDNVVGYILELSLGNMYGHKGNYSSYLEDKYKRMNQREKRDKQMEKMLSKEIEWLRSNQGAQRKHNKSRVQRIGQLEAEKAEKRLNQRAESGSLIIPEGTRLGTRVVEFQNVSYVTPDTGETILENISFQLRRGDILGIVGPNGSGKTTILRLLTGQIQPTSGRIDIGETVEFGYNTQQRDTSLNDEKMVWREIVGDRNDVIINPITGERMPARAYVAQFNFRGVDQQKLIGSLSGGERNRVHLAKSLVNGCNVLLLDEPTNDLDVDTLRALEESLQDYGGSAIIVSHDRFFLDRVCTNILSFEYDEKGQKYCFYYDGNYSQYEHYKRAVLGKDMKAEQQRFKNIHLNA